MPDEKELDDVAVDIEQIRAELLVELRPGLEAYLGRRIAQLCDEVDRLTDRLAAREAFLRFIDADNDVEPWDQDDEERRLTIALESVRSDDLHTASAVLYGTQSAIAREFLRRKGVDIHA